MIAWMIAFFSKKYRNFWNGDLSSIETITTRQHALQEWALNTYKTHIYDVIIPSSHLLSRSCCHQYNSVPVNYSSMNNLQYYDSFCTVFKELRHFLL